jgi:hypothetical protein
MIVGIDFDNTLICYDRVFHRVAVEQGLIPTTVTPTKTAVRDWLRAAGQEPVWTELQGSVYGQAIMMAEPYPGVRTFLDSCQRLGIRIRIISHKTRLPFAGPRLDLHAAAQDWLQTRLLPDMMMESPESKASSNRADQGWVVVPAGTDKQGVKGASTTPENTATFNLCSIRVFFEETLSGKLQRIREERCEWFIDDLPELLDEPDFPRQTNRILFDPHQRYPDQTDRYRFDSWAAIETFLTKQVGPFDD